jgi:hypothetical protein
MEHYAIKHWNQYSEEEMKRHMGIYLGGPYS